MNTGVVITLFFALLLGCTGESGQGKNQPGTKRESPGGTEVIAQKTCPVMGNPIDPEVYLDYQGRRIYFCCPGCDEKFLADPEKYLPKVAAEIAGQAPEPAPRAEEIAQERCPVRGNRINPDVHLNWEGRRIWFCCPGCIETFKQDPETYLAGLEEALGEGK
jgi:YHS domain-containing protein